MKNNLIIFFSILAIATTFAITQKSYFLSTEVLDIKCSYMMYACGDCYPQFKVIEIFSQGDINETILGQDIDVKFKNKEDQYFVDSCICITCYDFYLKGKIKKGSNGYIFFATKSVPQLKSRECCD